MQSDVSLGHCDPEVKRSSHGLSLFQMQGKAAEQRSHLMQLNESDPSHSKRFIALGFQFLAHVLPTCAQIIHYNHGI